MTWIPLLMLLLHRNTFRQKVGSLLLLGKPELWRWFNCWQRHRNRASGISTLLLSGSLEIRCYHRCISTQSTSESWYSALNFLCNIQAVITSSWYNDGGTLIPMFEIMMTPTIAMILCQVHQIDGFDLFLSRGSGNDIYGLMLKLILYKKDRSTKRNFWFYMHQISKLIIKGPLNIADYSKRVWNPSRFVIV